MNWTRILQTINQIEEIFGEKIPFERREEIVRVISLLILDAQHDSTLSETAQFALSLIEQDCPNPE